VAADAVQVEPVSGDNSLLLAEKQGIFSGIDQFGRFTLRFTTWIQTLRGQFPTLRSREFSAPNREFPRPSSEFSSKLAPHNFPLLRSPPVESRRHDVHGAVIILLRDIPYFIAADSSAEEAEMVSQFELRIG
jgi:hypothetical protein